MRAKFDRDQIATRFQKPDRPGRRTDSHATVACATPLIVFFIFPNSGRATGTLEPSLDDNILVDFSLHYHCYRNVSLLAFLSSLALNVPTKS
jgi:hypothetical protein